MIIVPISSQATNAIITVTGTLILTWQQRLGTNLAVALRAHCRHDAQGVAWLQALLVRFWVERPGIDEHGLQLVREVTYKACLHHCRDDSRLD